jgi:trehalose 6-phosphate phosphatase
MAGVGDAEQVQELKEISLLRNVIARKPLAIFSDIDGTLAPIVDDPSAAGASERSLRALRELRDRGVRIGLITGRGLARAQAMADVPGAIYATSHGLNIWDGGDIEAPAVLREWVERAQKLVAHTEALAEAGVTVEDKGPIFALHYRRAPSQEKALAAIADLARRPEAAGFRQLRGRMVVEFQPEIDIDKGTAATELARRMGARGVICMGDDTTDICMFDAVRLLREEGVETAVIGVHSPEVSEELLAACDYFVRGVEGVEWVLEELVRELRERGP